MIIVIKSSLVIDLVNVVDEWVSGPIGGSVIGPV